jgi:hypothetical protein
MVSSNHPLSHALTGFHGPTLLLLVSETLFRLSQGRRARKACGWGGSQYWRRDVWVQGEGSWQQG